MFKSKVDRVRLYLHYIKAYYHHADLKNRSRANGYATDIYTMYSSLRIQGNKILVRSQLEYCSTVWCQFTDSNISKLEAVDRRTAIWIKHGYGQTSSVTGMMQSLH